MTIEDQIAIAHAAMLERKAAKDKAEDDYQTARNLWLALRLESTGLAGHKVSYTRDIGWNGRTETLFFVVEGVREFGADLRGHRIRQDGEVTSQILTWPREKLTDHGPFTPKESK